MSIYVLMYIIYMYICTICIHVLVCTVYNIYALMYIIYMYTCTICIYVLSCIFESTYIRVHVFCTFTQEHKNTHSHTYKFCVKKQTNSSHIAYTCKNEAYTYIYIYIYIYICNIYFIYNCTRLYCYIGILVNHS